MTWLAEGRSAVSSEKDKQQDTLIANQRYQVGTATVGNCYTQMPITTTGGYYDWAQLYTSTPVAGYCSANSHVFECKHEKSCKCGKTQRTEVPCACKK